MVVIWTYSGRSLADSKIATEKRFCNDYIKSDRGYYSCSDMGRWARNHIPADLAANAVLAPNTTVAMLPRNEINMLASHEDGSLYQTRSGTWSKDDAVAMRLGCWIIKGLERATRGPTERRQKPRSRNACLHGEPIRFYLGPQLPTTISSGCPLNTAQTYASHVVVPSKSYQPPNHVRRPLCAANRDKAQHPALPLMAEWVRARRSEDLAERGGRSEMADTRRVSGERYGSGW